MKKIIYLLLISFLLSSCTYKNTSGWIYTGNDKAEANAYFDKILAAIEDKDQQALSQLFSVNAKKEIDSFDRAFTALCNYYQGTRTQVNYGAGPSVSESISDGEHQKEYQCTYDVITTEGVFRFAIGIIVEDSADEDNIGVYALYVIRGENTDMNIAYWGDGNWNPGIHFDLVYTGNNVIG